MILKRLTVCVTGGADGQDSLILWHETLQIVLRLLGRKPRPVHAVLGNHEPARTLAIKKAQSLTDNLAP